jgi:DNA-binding NtrC family response regulator
MALSGNKVPPSEGEFATSLAPLVGEGAIAEPAQTALLPAIKLPAGARLSEHHNQMIDSTLADCGGNISKAARSLGVSRGLLYRHLSARKSEPQAPVASD